jgi:hypothetical protein
MALTYSKNVHLSLNAIINHFDKVVLLFLMGVIFYSNSKVDEFQRVSLELCRNLILLHSHLGMQLKLCFVCKQSEFEFGFVVANLLGLNQIFDHLEFLKKH